MPLVEYGQPDQSSFTFVQCDQNGRPDGVRVRSVIRKQAMKKAAIARKLKGGYGQHNRLQLPSFLDEDILADASVVPEGRERQSQDADASPGVIIGKRPRQQCDVAFSCRLPRTCGVSCSGTMSQSLFLLLKLVPLTGLRLGLTSCSSLRSEVRHISGVGAFPNPGTSKLLSFIPSRYHEIPLVRHAIDCLAAKLCQLLQPADCRSSSDELILRHHTRTIEALRAALKDEAECLTPETLCAVELLSAFEV